MIKFPFVYSRSKPTLAQDLTKKLIYLVLIIFTLTSVLSLWLYSYESKKTYLAKHTEYLLYLGYNLELPLWNINKYWIRSICGSFSKNEIVSLLRVTGETGELMFEMVNEDEPSLIVTEKQIYYKDELVGNVELGFTNRLYQQTNRLMFFRSMWPILFVILGLMISSKIILNRSLKNPLSHLLVRIEEISAGQYKEQHKISEHFEISTILDKFNHMAERVERRETSLLEANKKLEFEIAERLEAENAHLESERRYQQLVEELPVGIFRSSTDYDGEFLMVNPAFVKMMGYQSEEELKNKNVKENYMDPDMRKIVVDMLLREETVQGLEVEFKKKNGQVLQGLITAQVVRGKRGNPVYIDGIIEDVSERNYLEKQIRQSQKMEAIGTLAGGIAHDFNNILASMFGFTEAAKMRYSTEQDADGYFDEILDAGLRARSLIRQMLAFSQQTEVERSIIPIDPIIKETLKFIRASLPAMIEITRDFRVKDCSVFADPTQIHQILMNLCTNSAHAMREAGGILKVGLDEIEVSDSTVQKYHGLSPGHYVKIDVYDNGTGIEKEIVDRIFEPFFTTKNRGEGSGMGLSVIHGIVNEMNGAIVVESDPGSGTCFHVLLPRIFGEYEQLATSTLSPNEGSGTILFVDDEEGFVTAGKEILERLGYRVVPATSGAEAILLFEANPDYFDVVITDLAMPKMTGFDLAQKLKEIRFNIPIILCTGFSAGIDKNSNKMSVFCDIVIKPILAKDLADAIQRALS